MAFEAESFDPDFASPADWARMYRHYGLQVIPSYAPDEVRAGQPWKRPRLAEWTTLQETLVPQATFERWYAPGGEYSQRYQMGILLGHCSENALMVDLDTHKNPMAINWWLGLLAVHNNNMELETPTQRTGGGGKQILFRARPDFLVPTNRTELGVDIRGQGGFAVVPRSWHEKGCHYDWMPGKAPYELPIMLAPEWLLTAISELVVNYGGGNERTKREHTAQPDYDFDVWGNRTDGREDAMFRLIWNHIVHWYRQCPIKPSQRESDAKLSEAWIEYERNTRTRIPGVDNVSGLERENRGHTEFYHKWQRAMSFWETRVYEASKQPNPHATNQQDFHTAGQQAAEDAGQQSTGQPKPGGAQQQQPPPDVFVTISKPDIKNLPRPQWLVDGLIPDRGLTFLYGAPKKGKSFIALDMALRINCGMDWHGRACRKGGILYIAGEGVGGYRNRVIGWHLHHGLEIEDTGFRLLPRAINLMRVEDIEKLVRTVVSVIDDAQAVFIDTVARSLPGADENASKEMGLFIAACDAVRDVCHVAVIGVHHSGKDEERGMRGSSAFRGAADCVLLAKREEGSDTVELITEDQKDDEPAAPIYMKMIKVEWLDGLKQASTLVPEITGKQSQKSSAVLDKPACRRILAEIRRAWDAGKPWSNAPQTRQEGRYLPDWIMCEFKCRRQEVDDLIQAWFQNKIITVEFYSKKSGFKGMRVIGSID